MREARINELNDLLEEFTAIVERLQEVNYEKDDFFNSAFTALDNFYYALYYLDDVISDIEEAIEA